MYFEILVGISGFTIRNQQKELHINWRGEHERECFISFDRILKQVRDISFSIV